MTHELDAAAKAGIRIRPASQEPGKSSGLWEVWDSESGDVLLTATKERCREFAAMWP